MSTRDTEHALQSFMEDSIRLIAEVDQLQSFVSGTERSSASEISHEMRRKTMASIGETDGLIVDGSAIVTISQDEMEAVADFYPAAQDMEPFTSDQFAELLRRRGVTTGIDWAVVSDALLRCTTELEPITGVVVARGRTARHQTPPHFDIEARLFLRAEPVGADDEGRQVDHHTRSPFTMVHQGESLAHLMPCLPGETGISVRGAALPFEIEKAQFLEPGKNIVFKGHVAVAECDGRFQFDSTCFYVNEVLELSNDVDYSTGNIDFVGDVIVRGNIREGFSVHAKGAVLCGRTIEASEVECGGDLFVRQGVIGKGKGVVKVGGRLDAKYIENCYVEAKGSMYIGVGMMNSAVHTLDRIDLGHKGVIVGGVVYAQNGITATQLGSQSGVKTEIYCGTDFFVEHKLQWIRDRTTDLATKLSRVIKEVKRSASPRSELIDLRDKLRAAIHQMNEAAMNSVSVLDQNDEAQVVVRGRVYPDVYIEICHCSYVVTRAASKVRFRLDKSTGSVLMEPLRKDGQHEEDPDSRRQRTGT